MAGKFYCPTGWRDGRAVLDEDESDHLAKACRVEVGEDVVLFDGKGQNALAKVAEIAKKRVSLTIIDPALPNRALPGRFVLATAVPKGERFDWLVEKATELGVTQLVPLITQRSVVDPRSSKLDRLRRLIIEACKQSGRGTLMELARPTSWADWLSESTALKSRFIAHPGVASQPEAPDFVGGIAVAIGPEGGFTEAEVASARAGGFQPMSLGPLTLRIETAALAASATLIHSALSPTSPGARS